MTFPELPATLRGPQAADDLQAPRKLVDLCCGRRQRRRETLQHFLVQSLPCSAIHEFLQALSKNRHTSLFPPRRKTSSSREPPGGDQLASFEARGPWQYHASLVDLYFGRWLSANLEAYELMFPNGIPKCCTHSHKKLRGASLEELIGLVPMTRTSSVEPASPSESELEHGQSSEPHYPVGGVSKILCHASTFSTRVNKVFAFGGLTPQGCSDTLWSLDLSSAISGKVSWKRADAGRGRQAAKIEIRDDEMGRRAAQVPCRRFNHTLVAWDKYLILFGGDGAPGYLDDLWFFDVTIGTWDRISLESEQQSCRPGSRAGHTAVVTNDDQMILFGGWRGVDGFSDVWAFNFPSRCWVLLSPHKSSPEKRESHLTIAGGASPWGGATEQRSGVTTVTRGGSMYSGESLPTLGPLQSGGLASPGSSRVVEEGFEENGELRPFARHWHAAGVLGESEMYIHGGYGPHGVLKHLWKFNWRTRVWSFVSVQGPSPPKRCRHASATVHGRQLVVMGGKDGQGLYFDDLWIFDLASRVWTEILLYTPPPLLPSSKMNKYSWWTDAEMLRRMPSLHCHSMTYDTKHNVLVITGGCDGECIALDSTLLLRRSPAAAALCFEEWRKRPAVKEPKWSLPAFIATHPSPYTEELLKFL